MRAAGAWQLLAGRNRQLWCSNSDVAALSARAEHLAGKLRIWTRGSSGRDEECRSGSAGIPSWDNLTPLGGPLRRLFLAETPEQKYALFSVGTFLRILMVTIIQGCSLLLGAKLANQ
jgi:hypothetical protein